MKKPSRYYVSYESPELKAAYIRRHPEEDGQDGRESPDPAHTWTHRDFTTLGAARRFARVHGSDVIERLGIIEDALAPGMWDYIERRVD